MKTSQYRYMTGVLCMICGNTSGESSELMAILWYGLACGFFIGAAIAGIKE